MSSRGDEGETARVKVAVAAVHSHCADNGLPVAATIAAAPGGCNSVLDVVALETAAPKAQPPWERSLAAAAISRAAARDLVGCCLQQRQQGQYVTTAMSDRTHTKL